MPIVRDFFRDETGATAIEYTLILGLVAMAIIGAIGDLREDVSNLFNYVAGLFNTSIGV